MDEGALQASPEIRRIIDAKVHAERQSKDDRLDARFYLACSAFIVLAPVFALTLYQRIDARLGTTAFQLADVTNIGYWCAFFTLTVIVALGYYLSVSSFSRDYAPHWMKIRLGYGLMFGLLTMALHFL
jgi:hypothetical protein